MKNNVCILTGQIGCGKSTIAQKLNTLGYNVFDADDIVRFLQQPGQYCYNQIVKNFQNIVLEDKQLDRKQISQQVFGPQNMEKLQLLNKIVHPQVNKQIKKILFFNIFKLKILSGIPQDCIYNRYNKALIVVIPLWLEQSKKTIFPVFDIQLSSQEEQIKRLLNRGHSHQDAVNRIKAQMSFDERRKRANRVFINDSPDTNILVQQLSQYINNYQGGTLYTIYQHITQIIFILLVVIVYLVIF
ncbi:Dephospho-CoA kinase [Spironucleus salmonicida]|uniref:Dephospho-CoA kinase n=1 Tax=Spironucleus salmonicida TaxID=348837 RepID=V6LKB2_9EUKA|nr:Dephospho-CoA kinase [Spironucleus salmonicida]|eukprot:EST45075.1 Dephospho-CoA kinase [Spironucleus salmonicida]